MAEIQQKFECLPFSSRLHRAGNDEPWLGLEICTCSERPRPPVSRCCEAREPREILREPRKTKKTSSLSLVGSMQVGSLVLVLILWANPCTAYYLHLRRG